MRRLLEFTRLGCVLGEEFDRPGAKMRLQGGISQKLGSQMHIENRFYRNMRGHLAVQFDKHKGALFLGVYEGVDHRGAKQQARRKPQRLSTM